MLKAAAESSGYGRDGEIIIVQNWFDELERLVPTD
jgi:hypothetical protein